MPPRRSHKKSRAGCRRCKFRKVKCDEVHPRCGNCSKHGVMCDFENPGVAVELHAASSASSVIDDSASTPAESPYTPGSSFNFATPAPINAPSPTISASTPVYRTPSVMTLSSTTPPSQRLLEMKLLHHYTAETYKTFTETAPATEHLWQITVPSMAFSGSPHLIDAMLAISALHLRHLTPNDHSVVRASHAYMAASLAEYSSLLDKGIDGTNAETLFLTSTLIAFQATATRVFIKDENIAYTDDDPHAGPDRGTGSGAYSIPFSWLHSFQGVKTVIASSWPWLRSSTIAAQVINSQVVLQLDFNSSAETFFGHLLEGLDEELDAMRAESYSHHQNGGSSSLTILDSVPAGVPPPSPQEEDPVRSTRQAYQHAVAVLNWAHAMPHPGAQLAFPATVSRRFIELLKERRPRALAILACFFALLKTLDKVWWLNGMARREVLGVVSLFNSDSLGRDAYARWWPHLEWAMRIALYDDSAGPIPPEVWGVDWGAEEHALSNARMQESYFAHIETLTQMLGLSQPRAVENYGP